MGPWPVKHELGPAELRYFNENLPDGSSKRQPSTDLHGPGAHATKKITASLASVKLSRIASPTEASSFSLQRWR